MAKIVPPTAQGVVDGSILLQPGMNFHYDVHRQDGTVCPILRLETVEKGGKTFPMVRSTDACTILPISVDKHGRPRGAWIMRQAERPEMAEDEIVDKTVGAFCLKGQARAVRAVETLREKFGVIATPDQLIWVGVVPGFGPQFRFPVDLYILVNPTIDKSLTLASGCSRAFYTPRQLAEMHVNRKFDFDDTIDVVGMFLSMVRYPHLRVW